MKSLPAVIALLTLALASALLIHLNSGNPRAPVTTGDGRLPPPPVSDRPLTLTNSESCRECHPDVYREWAASHHRIAYVNPEVQRLSKEFQDKDCLPCHLPRPVFETGLGVRVLERATRKSEGVDCFTCHRSGDACLGVGPLGPAAATAPCNPMPYAGLATMTLCAPCHDQHKVHQDWLATRFAVEGSDYKDCNTCHMPEVIRKRPDGGTRKGRSHLFPAAHDAVMLRSAVTLTVSKTGVRTLLVSVENTGTGHNFPADERHRAGDLEVEVEGSQNRRTTFRVDRYRNPYREEFGIKNPLREPGATRTYAVPVQGFGDAAIDARRVAARFNPVRKVYYPESTQIPAGESRTYTVTLPEGVTAAVVRLWYRTNPYQKDKDAVRIAERRITFR